MVYSLTQEQIEQRLGRSLSDGEVKSLDSIAATAKSLLEQALNSRLDGDDERLFLSNEGFKQLFTGPFTAISSVFVDDAQITSSDYMAMWSDGLGNVSNSVRFTEPMRDNRIIRIKAAWGFGDSLPDDLLGLWIQLFDAVSHSTIGARDDNGRLVGDITSEKIIDYSVNYAKSSQAESGQVLMANEAILAKYRTPDNISLPTGIGEC